MMDLFALHYNTTIVFIATAALGVSAGLVGCFLVLRKEALVSDAVSHATLPGIGIGFLIAYALEINDGRSLPLLLLCSGITAYLGAVSVLYITNHTRLSADTAIASVMSFFYGCGLMLLSVIQNMDGGNRAGLNSFLLGQVSGLTKNDLILLSCVSLVVIALTVMLFKNLRLLCFDRKFAEQTGLTPKRTESFLLFLMILVVCTGLKTVGLILIIALLIIPAVTARLWVTRTESMAALSGLFGAASCVMGVYVSSDVYNLPTGASIVVCAFTLFVLSAAVRFRHA